MRSITKDRSKTFLSRVIIRTHGTVVLPAVWIALAFLPPARAGSIPYPWDAFVLTNDNADGTAMPSDGGRSVILTGGNNGSDLLGTTDFLTVAAVPGMIQFDYSYASLDLPGFDRAGYVLGSVFTIVADTDGQAGTAMFSVMAGDIFGFRVETDDNTGEPGVFTISGFTAIPEPGTWALTVAAAVAFGSIRLGRRRFLYREKRK